jgi:hypothetical protein
MILRGNTAIEMKNIAPRLVGQSEVRIDEKPVLAAAKSGSVNGVNCIVQGSALINRPAKKRMPFEQTQDIPRYING